MNKANVTIAALRSSVRVIGLKVWQVL